MHETFALNCDSHFASLLSSSGAFPSLSAVLPRKPLRGSPQEVDTRTPKMAHVRRFLLNAISRDEDDVDETTTNPRLTRPTRNDRTWGGCGDSTGDEEET